MPFQHRGQWRPSQQSFVSADKKKINGWHFTKSNSPTGTRERSLHNVGLKLQKTKTWDTTTNLRFIPYPPTALQPWRDLTTRIWHIWFCRHRTSRPKRQNQKSQISHPPIFWLSLRLMQKIKSILLLFALGIMLFPWKLICIAHPLGHSHQHHEPGKLSPCELHAKYAKAKGQHLLPPMHCHTVSANTDDFQTTDQFKIKPTYQTLAIVAGLFDFIKITYPEQPYNFPPEPKCRSAPFVSPNSLRSPPIC